MVTISYAFQFNIVLKIFKISGHLSKNQTIAIGLEGIRTLKKKEQQNKNTVYMYMRRHFKQYTIY